MARFETAVSRRSSRAACCDLPRLAAARAQFKQRAICADTLRRIEDDCIRTLVDRQESIGLRSITDGELRRAYWHIDFLQELDGVTIAALPNQNLFGGTEEQPPMATVTGKIGCTAPIMADAFAYLKNHYRRKPPR